MPFFVEYGAFKENNLLPEKTTLSEGRQHNFERVPSPPSKVYQFPIRIFHDSSSKLRQNKSLESPPRSDCNEYQEHVVSR